MPRPTDHRQTEATPKAKARATSLRKEMPLPEVLLWRELKNKKLSGLRFRRQHPLGPWIADFYCHEIALVIEIDGNSHQHHQARDQDRDAWMQARRLTVLRMPATHVLNNMHATLTQIQRVAQRSSPVSNGGGGTAQP